MMRLVPAPATFKKLGSYTARLLATSGVTLRNAGIAFPPTRAHIPLMGVPMDIFVLQGTVVVVCPAHRF